ncbi:hypothetical protein [Rhizobium sp. NPDC090279]|uniref:hypothetical protein n=1 Tax=Rhizobium sp. NPDC090279 TaxID=3364499 RepID=UPI00383A71BA
MISIKRSFPDKENESDQELLQRDLPDVAAISSVEAWQAMGIARIFNSYLPLRFDDQFLQHEHFDCDAYIEWLSSNDRSLPDVAEVGPRLIFGIADGGVVVANNVVIFTQRIEELAKARFAELKTEGVYSLESRRFQKITELAGVNFFGNILHTATIFERELLAAVEDGGLPVVTRDRLGGQTTAKLDAVENYWKRKRSTHLL